MTVNESPSDAPRGADSEPAESPGPGAIQLIALVVRHLRLVIGMGFVVGVAVGFYVLITPRTFTSRVSFVPQQPGQQAPAFAGLAAQFGINLGGGQSSESPGFYSELLRSRELLWRIAERTYEVQTDTGLVVGTVAGVFNLEYDDPDRRTFEATELLGEITVIAPSTRTGIVEIQVKTRWRDLSRDLSQAYLDEVNRFNLEVRRGRAVAEQEFAEARLEESRAELKNAEDGLEAFLEQNRIVSSPQLEIELDRHRRQVDVFQQVVISLSSSYEQARIDAVRNTPVIAVIEPARRPTVGDARGTIRKSGVAAAAAGILALLFSLLLERFRFARDKQDPELEELARNLRELNPFNRR